MVLPGRGEPLSTAQRALSGHQRAQSAPLDGAGMAHITRTRSVIVLLVVVGIVVGIAAATIVVPGTKIADAEARPATAPVVPAAPVILTPEYGELITWAFDAYAAAGLPLIDVRVGVYDDETSCGEGRKGYHYVGDDGVSVVLVCALHKAPRLQERSRRHVLLHELAHAWTEQQLTQTDKDRFLAARELSVWSDGETAWGHLGAEHAAEIIAWNISEAPYLPHPELTDSGCDGFTIGYVILTGHPAPPNRNPICS